jgi:hypothetical protein
MSKHSQQRRLFFAFILILLTNAVVSYFIFQIVDRAEITANTSEIRTDKLVPQVAENTRIIKRYFPTREGNTGTQGETGQRGFSIRGPRGHKGNKGDKGDMGESGTKVVEVRRTIVVERVGPPGAKGEKGDDGVTRTVPQKCDPLQGYFCADPDDPYDGIP